MSHSANGIKQVQDQECSSHCIDKMTLKKCNTSSIPKQFAMKAYSRSGEKLHTPTLAPWGNELFHSHTSHFPTNSSTTAANWTVELVGSRTRLDMVVNRKDHALTSKSLYTII